MFDDLVRRTAAGTIVLVHFRVGGTTHRFWVTDTDRDRLEDLCSDDAQLPSVPEADAPRSCQPQSTVLQAGPSWATNPTQPQQRQACDPTEVDVPRIDATIGTTTAALLTLAGPRYHRRRNTTLEEAL
jgi:hypothetical protein